MAEPDPASGKKKGRGPQTAIVSRNAVEELVKERVERSPTIDAKALNRLIELIDQFSLRLANTASDRSLQASRKRIQIEDVDGAYTAIAGANATPETVFGAIEKLDIEQLRDLVLTITQWLKEKQRAGRG